MTSYKNIVVVQANEAGQPTNLLSLGDNDTISDEVLSPEVQDAVSSVPALRGDVTSLSAQVTAIEGISVTALEGDIVVLGAATSVLDNQVTGLYTATGDLYNQVTAIDGISVTALENDIIDLGAATSVLDNQVTGLYTATGDLYNQVTAIDGVSVTAIEQDILVLYDQTGLNFHDVTGLQSATGTLNTAIDNVNNDVTGLEDATGLLFHDVTGLQDATGTLDTEIGFLGTATGTLNTAINNVNNDVTGLEDATGLLFHDVTGLQDATGTLNTAINNVTNDVTGLEDATGLLFHDVTGLQDATGTLDTEIGFLGTATGTLNTAINNVNNDVTGLEDATGLLFHDVTGLEDATGVLNTEIGFLGTATGTLNTAINNVSNDVTGLESATGTLNTAINNVNNDVTSIIDATGLLAGRVTENEGNIDTANDNTQINALAISNLITATGLQYHDVTGLQDATGTLDSDITAVEGDITTLQGDVTALYAGTGTLYHDVTALEAGGGGGGGGIPNPLDEDLDLTGFQILNVEKITGDPNELNLKFEHPGLDMRAGVATGGGAATGTIGIYGDAFVARSTTFSDPDAGIVRLGRQIPLNGGNGVYVSGNGPGDVTGTSPVNGAALTYDDSANRLVWKKIQSGNIGVGVITGGAGGNIAAGTITGGTGGNIVTGTITGDNIEDGSINGSKLADATAANSIGFGKLRLIPAQTIVGNPETFLNGPMDALTAAEAAAIVNSVDQEITGNVGINTAATPTVPLQIEDTGTDDVILVETTDDSSDAGPVITLMRDPGGTAAANNDYIGQFKFKGENDAGDEKVYAKITAKIDVATAGDEDGIIEFMNRKDGSEQIAARFKGSSFRTLNGVDVLVDGDLGVGTTNPSEKLDVQGNIAVTGTVDGRDIASDGAKLDTIATGATENSGDLADLDTVGTLYIDNDAVTHAKYQEISDLTLLGNNSGGTSNPQALDATAVRAVLNVENGATADQSLANANQEITANRTISNGSNNYNIFFNLTDTAANNDVLFLLNPAIPSATWRSRNGTESATLLNTGSRLDFIFGGTAEFALNSSTGSDGQAFITRGSGDGPEWGGYTTYRQATAPSNTNALWYHTTDEELYAYDSSRSKWLSVTTYEAHFALGGSTTTQHYLRGPGNFNYNTASQIGHPMRYNTTVIAAWGSCAAGGTSGWNHRVTKWDDSAGSNGVAAQYAPTGTYTRWSKTDFNADFDVNDLMGLNMFDLGSATTVTNHTAVVAYKRRPS